MEVTIRLNDEEFESFCDWQKQYRAIREYKTPFIDKVMATKNKFLSTNSDCMHVDDIGRLE
ncbi:hypothetical protein ACI3PL_29255, partial [Lacticaseibacillus paracasei]